MSTALTGQQRLVTTIAILASFVTMLDSSIVNVALPAIERELHGGLITQQWVVDGYLVSLSALMLLAGSIADAYGRVLVMRVGLIGFGIASVVIAASIDPTMLVIGRVVQGAAGAFLLPSSLALITSRISGPAQGHAIGVWTAVTTGAMLVGPVLGGLLTDHASWRLAFLINVVPIAITLWLLTQLTEADTNSRLRIDWFGGVACAVGLGLLTVGLIEQPRFGWTSPFTIAFLVGGVVVLAVFLWRQTRVAHPILPFSLFRVGNFAWGNLATLFVYAALPLNGFVMGIYLQEEAGMSATLAGLASLPVTIMMILLSSRMGALSGKLGPRLFMSVGPLIMAAGALLLLLVAQDFDYWWQVLPAMIVMGFGLAVTVSPLTSAILGSIGPEQSGIASAVNNAVSRFAGLIVIAMLSTIVGGSLNLAGFHSAAIVTAALFAAGGIVSWLGIRNPPRDEEASAAEGA